MAFSETQQLAVQLDLKGNFRAGLRDAAKAVQGFDRATGRTQRSLSKFGSNIQRGIVVGAAAAAGGITAVVKAAADYESAFAGVRKTVTATEPQLKQLSDQFRALSKQIPISASELARLGEAGGALGVPTNQLKEFVRVTALLGVTTDLTADEAADSLGVLGNVLHLTGQEYSKFASSLVALGNAGASTESQIIQIAERAGAAGHLIGLTTDQILGLSSAVASIGIEPEAGGSSLQKFFIETTKAVSEAGPALKKFAQVAGVSAKDFAKTFKNDAGAALQEFLAGLGKLSQAQQLDVLEKLGFNDIRITRTLLGLANNTKLVSDQMDVANKAFKQNTALTKEAEQRFNTFDSQLQITKNVLTDMAITIGSKLLPKITPLLKRLNEFVSSHQADIERFGDNLASGFEKLADALGKVDWQPFIDGLKISAGIAKTVVGAFQALPADLQKLVIAGFALNKVTGGLGTSIAKDIGGAILGQLAKDKLGKGGNPANPLFVWQVNGGLGGALPAAGGAAAAAALPVAVIAASIVGPIVAQQKISSDQQIIAYNEVTTRVQQQIASGASLQDLQKSLAAVNSGIEEIQSNPLNMVVGGQALEELKSQSSSLQQAIDAVKLAGRDTVGGVEHLATAQAATLGAMRAEAAENRASLSALPGLFARNLAAIQNAKQEANIVAAVKAAVAQVNAKREGLGAQTSNTAAFLKAMKAQLKNVHDPSLQKTLRAVISKVEGRLSHLKELKSYAATQVHKADGLLRNGIENKHELKGLQSIERSLRDHGLPRVANRIREKIEAAKKAQVSASNHTADAIRRKKLQVTTNVTVPVTSYVSVQGVLKKHSVISRYSGNIAT